MEEAKPTQGTETQKTAEELGLQRFVTHGRGGSGESLATREEAAKETIRSALKDNMLNESALFETILELIKRSGIYLIIEVISEIENTLDERSLHVRVRDVITRNVHKHKPLTLKVLLYTLQHVFRSTDVDTLRRIMNEELRNLIAESKIDFNETSIIPFRITEEPLTPQTLAITFTALTELTTKLWLIAKHRFADLMEYTQTHDIRFANEAGATIVWATYNSPFSFALNFDKVVPGIAEAFITTMDGVIQRDVRLQKAELENQAKAQQIELDKQKAELENQAKAQQIELDKQKAEHEQKMADFERKIKELELQERQAELMFKIEERRADLLERILELFNKKRDIGIEIAGNAVNILLPYGDASTKLMLGQSLLPNILQIQDITGLELILPKPKVDEGNPEEDAGK